MWMQGSVLYNDLKLDGEKFEDVEQYMVGCKRPIFKFSTVQHACWRQNGGASRWHVDMA